MKAASKVLRLLSDAGAQTALLFILDGLANVLDFAFHFWMGRALSPSEFALLQTLNSIVLVYVTATSIFQPVVGRFVAESRAKADGNAVPAIFRSFLGAALGLGIGWALVSLILSSALAQWLNVPAWTIQISAFVIFLSTLRPVAAGVLQGQERFIGFGFTRALTSLGRLLLGIILVSQGMRLRGAVIAFPFGWLLGVMVAFLLLGKSVWKKGGTAPAGLLQIGWKLSAYALLAYLTFMSLTSLDLIWANRTLAPAIAGSYASLVLLRRVIALLPGVAVLVMFPRVAATLAQGRLPDRLLVTTAAVILATSGALTGIYFLFGDHIILWIFGSAYHAASSLLGWMGIAMIGVSLSSIWLNYYLAHKPAVFVALLCFAVAFEWALLTYSSASMQSAVRAFGITGWLLTLAGLLLYVFRYRPALVAAK